MHASMLCVHRICLCAYEIYFLMMCLLWVVTNHWIFTEIGHEFVFKCDLFCGVMLKKFPMKVMSIETLLLINH